MARRSNPKPSIIAEQTVSDEEAPATAQAEATAGAPAVAEAPAAEGSSAASEPDEAAFRMGQPFADFFLRIQQTQLQMLQEWMDSLQAAWRSNSASGFDWGGMFGAQMEALNAGLAQLAAGQQSLYGTWIEMQTRWAQMVQEQIAQFVRITWNVSDRENGDAQASQLMPISPSVLYDQAQSSFDALMRQWKGAVQAMGSTARI